MQNNAINNTNDRFSIIIGKNVQVKAFNYITNNTHINDNTVLHPFNFINNSTIGKNSSITSSKIDGSVIKNNVTIGPNSNLIPETIVTDNVQIKNFLETKNTTIKNNTNASHMS
jgi:bifunctional UDP-N-acetylglucosamine pyrophosphorylase/glucosamine-1-phosphate N-acetyltransferase